MKSKIKIMKAKPEVNDDEIRNFMDFDKLLLQSAELSAQVNKRMLRNTGLAIVGMMIIASATWFLVSRENVQAPDQSQKKPTQQITPEKTPVIKNKTDSPVVASTPRETPKPVNDQKNTRKTESKGEKSVEVKERPKPAAPAGEVPVVYVQAEPEAGYPALYEYFAKELTYPATALKDSVQGVVSVAFTISKDGKPERIAIEQSLGAAFDEEAIRVIRNMPAWKPATYNGKPLASRMSVPLTFQITKNKVK
jgi:TonB family protein